jgi:hypothetical protein
MSYRKELVELYRQGKIDETAIIKMAAFQQDIEDMMEKNAFDWAIGANFLNKPADVKNLKNILKTVGILSAITAGSAGIQKLLSDAYEKFKNTMASREAYNNFDTVYSESTELQKYPKDIAKKYFNTLYHFSPKMATDPMATESWLLQTVSWHGSDTGVPLPHLKDITDVQEKSQRAGSGNLPFRLGSETSNVIKDSYREQLRRQLEEFQSRQTNLFS